MVPNTYCRHGTYEGMAGTGVTRPDWAYTNEAGMPFIRAARTHYKSHAILELELDIAMFQSQFRTLRRPQPFDLKLLEGKQEREEQEERAARMWGVGQQQAFQDALKIEDVEGAMAIWRRAAEDYLLDLTEQRQGTPWEPEERNRLRGRGEVPRTARLTKLAKT